MPRKDPRKQYEYIFTPQDGLDSFTFDETVADIRKGLVDKLMKKLPSVRPPAWRKDGQEMAFTSGGGATGKGSIWTRPVALTDLRSIESAVFHFIERRRLWGGSGAQEIRFHVRANARVGRDDDMEVSGHTLHDQSAPADGTWHSHTFDLTDLLRRHEARPAYVTAEIAVESASAREEEQALEFAFKGFTLVVNVPPETELQPAHVILDQSVSKAS
ncbi:MAG: hypothetical protein HY556_05325 [Euryarchaeota archaeon]|nr:hypothetical protein [Euryarchaeota archaeon]